MIALWGIWWVWIAAALAFAIIEIFVPVFFFLGMAVGAAVVGVGLAFGLLGLVDGSPSTLLVVFAAASVAAAVGLRAALGVRKGQMKVWDRDINE